MFLQCARDRLISSPSKFENPMIIDAHMHVGTKYGWSWSAKDALKMMDESHIDMAIVTGLGEVPGENSVIEELVKTLDDYPQRFPYGFLRMNPWFGEKAAELFEETIKKHPRVKGIKFHPSSAPIWPNHPFALTLWRKAGEHNCPVYIHSGTDPMSLPLQIGKAAKECPQTKFLLGHYGGFFYYEDAIKVASKYKNIYLETSLIPYPEAIKKGVRVVGADRIVFGSDLPPLNPSVELKKFDLAGLAEAEKDKILWRNIADLLEIRTN